MRKDGSAWRRCPRSPRVWKIGWRIPRWLAAFAALVVIWVVIATLCSLFVPLVFNKINQLAHVDFAAVSKVWQKQI